MKLHEIEELDTVDAMVFSGDKLHDRDTLELFKRCLVRWQKAANNIDEIVREREEEWYENN